MEVAASDEAVVRGGNGDCEGGISITINDLSGALSSVAKAYLRAASISMGHVIRLAVLVFALGGCVMVQCCVVAWLVLVFLQARVLLGAAGVLRVGLEGVAEEGAWEAVDEVVEEEEGEGEWEGEQEEVVEEDAVEEEEEELLQRMMEREMEVREGIREAKRAEEEQRVQRERERLKEMERLHGERERRRAARAAIAEAERLEEERQMHKAREEPVPAPPTPTRDPLSRIEKKAQEQRSWLMDLMVDQEQAPRKAPENRKLIPSEWKITPEALQEARSFANEATRGGTHRRPAQAQQQHQKKPSMARRAKQPPPPTSTPTKAAPKPAHSQHPSQTTIPPHLRKSKDSSEDKENASPLSARPESVPLPNAAPLPALAPPKHFSINEMKSLNPATAAAIVRPAKTPSVPPGFQAIAADPRRHQESFDALLSPIRSDIEVVRAETAEVIANVQAPVTPAMQVSAEEVEKQRKAVAKAEQLYQDALNYFQMDTAREGGKGGDRRLERAEAYLRQKREALREVVGGHEEVRGRGEGGNLIELE